MKKSLLLVLAVVAMPWPNLQAESPLASFVELHKKNPTIYANRSRLVRAWVLSRKLELDAQSKVARTVAGPIEYKIRGKGPAVICLHGAFGGYDASFQLGESLVSKGFTVVAVSRPGYLRTPLSVGQSPEEQADAMIALMDRLGIEQAAVVGFSAGSLTAFQMAAKFPDRIWACVLQGVGALPADFEPGGTYEILRALVADDGLVVPFDLASWFLYETARNAPKLTANLILSDDVLTGFPASELTQRIRYVLQTPQQSAFLKQFAITLTPYSLRRAGDFNDIKDDISIDPWQSWVDAGIPQAVTVPVQIIQAVWDGSGNYEEVRNLIAPNIPGCELVPLQGCGHFVWLGKNTYAWEKKMQAFLKKHQP